MPLALAIISGLMITGVIGGYAGGWMWAIFAISVLYILAHLEITPEKREKA